MLPNPAGSSGCGPHVCKGCNHNAAPTLQHQLLLQQLHPVLKSEEISTMFYSPGELRELSTVLLRTPLQPAPQCCSISCAQFPVQVFILLHSHPTFPSPTSAGQQHFEETLSVPCDSAQWENQLSSACRAGCRGCL